MAKDNKDFLQPLLDLMQKNSDRLETKVDENTSTTNKTLDKVTGLEDTVNRHDIAIASLQMAMKEKNPAATIKKDLGPWYRDPMILKILLYILLIVLIIAGAITGINIGEYL